MKPSALSLAAALLVLAAAPVGAQEITGAGSTFAHPILSRWSSAYQRAQSDAEYQPVGLGLDYEPIGSHAGIMRLREAAVDFGATDVPLSAEELARYNLGQFPIVIGGVVAAVNVAGIKPGQLKLTGEVLAEIYLGRITNWSDPALQSLNPDLTLPDRPIVVVRRTDGSGTTFNFTHYLSKRSRAWKAQIGEALIVTWPVGQGAKGNEGVAERVKATGNTIGYVDFAQSRKAGLSHALLRNRAGRFVEPSVESFQAAAASADWSASADFNLLLADAPGDKAYPIVATTFAVMAKQTRPSKRAIAAFAFFDWAFANGAKTAEDLGYVALPPALTAQITRYWTTSFRLAR